MKEGVGAKSVLDSCYVLWIREGGGCKHGVIELNEPFLSQTQF